MHSALFIAAYDSQLKWCGPIKSAFLKRGYTCRAVMPDSQSALSDPQIFSAGFEAIERLSWDEIKREALQNDIVVISLIGPTLRRFIFNLFSAQTGVQRPVLVTGWVGVIFDKLLAGYLDRAPCDVVAVNSTEDLRKFENTAKQLGIPIDNLVLTGLPLLAATAKKQRSCDIRKVLFADQPTVPSRKTERYFIYKKINEYALLHPNREVILKPRHRLSEDTLHKIKYHPELLLKDTKLARNFRIDYTPISEIIESVDLLVTISSTAALEALSVGTKVAFPLDLGLNERFGNHIFLNSGLLRTFSQINKDDIGHPDTQWLKSYFFERCQYASEIIADRCELLIENHYRPSTNILNSAYFAAMIDAHHSIDTATSNHERPSLLIRKSRKLFSSPSLFFSDAIKKRIRVFK